MWNIPEIPMNYPSLSPELSQPYLISMRSPWFSNASWKPPPDGPWRPSRWAASVRWEDLPGTERAMGFLLVAYFKPKSRNWLKKCWKCGWHVRKKWCEPATIVLEHFDFMLTTRIKEGWQSTGRFVMSMKSGPCLQPSVLAVLPWHFEQQPVFPQ